MDPTLLALAALIIGLAGGFAAGWLIANRPVAELRGRLADVERDYKESEAKFLRAFAELEGAKEREKANATNFAERERLLIEAKDSLLKEFQNAGAKVLGEAQKSFLDRATERFDHAEKAN